MIIILTAISIAVSVYLVRQYLRSHIGGCACHPDYEPLEPRRLWR